MLFISVSDLGIWIWIWILWMEVQITYVTFRNFSLRFVGAAEGEVTEKTGKGQDGLQGFILSL